MTLDKVISNKICSIHQILVGFSEYINFVQENIKVANYN